MDLGLTSRVAFVTGAASGIGKAIAESLAAEGCIVWVADRDGDQAERTAEALAAGDRRTRAAVVDVTHPDAVTAAVRRAVETDGRIDILVCNAGVLKSGSFRASSAADWDSVVAVNLSGVINCVREVVDVMAGQGGGRIVNVASVAAMRGGGSIGNILYGTSKAGVVALTHGLARELGPIGITVNAVAPAITDTPMTHALLTAEVQDRILARVPLGRLATPAEIADVVTFLASARASFINGAIVPVDGGILTT